MFGVSKGAKEESVCWLSFSVIAFVCLSLSGPTHNYVYSHNPFLSPSLSSSSSQGGGDGY